MPELTAEILLERGAGGADQVLTYTVPTALAPQIRIGQRVVVPLGQRRSSGLVLALGVPAPEAALRPISSIISPEPLVDGVGAALANWLADRYLCRRCDAWRLFLPPGVLRAGARRICLATSPAEIKRRLTKFILPEADRSHFELVLNGLNRGGRTPEKLRQDLGLLYDQLEVMLAEGYLAWQEPWQKKTPGARQVTHISLGPARPAKPTPKQAKILAYLEGRPEGTAAKTEILAACGVGPSVLERLIASGFLAAGRRSRQRIPAERSAIAADQPPVLYPAQEAAVSWVGEHLPEGGGMLLHGVTGSGKTEVYLRSLALALAAGRTGMLLVPEIGLTPQTVERVVARFGDRVAVLHSRLSLGERLDEWERIRAGEARIVVGPRSALFAPLRQLGLIILDEEHDASYKQEDGVRYHSREVAFELSRLAGAVLIMGSATPSLEAMAACERGDAVYLSLPERPGGRLLPPVELVDLRVELKARRTGVLSQRLREALTDCLGQGGQAILLLNRRGYATFVICRECGYVLRCPHCEVSLTYHQGQANLLCHYCGYSRPAPDTCPGCGGRYIRYFGLGTERLSEEVTALFPDARVVRMDQDSTAHKGAHHQIYRDLREGRVDILIGTQMVAKGLDLPRVTLVGVVAADASLNRPDFRAAERTFQLLTQVAGRAGRGDQSGLVILQTYNPAHYSLVCAATHDYHAFFALEREARLAARYPPYAEMVRVGLTGHDDRITWQAAEELTARLGEALKAARLSMVEILGPTAALVRKVEDRYRYHLLVKGDRLADFGPILGRVAAEFREVHRASRVMVFLDVNPNTVL